MKLLPEKLKCKMSENKIWAKTELNCEQKEVLRQKLDCLWIKEWIWLLKRCSIDFQNDFIFWFVSYILIICWFLIATNLDPLLSKKSAVCLHFCSFVFSGSSLEEILAAARDQPDSVEQSALVEDVDSDETSSDASESEEKLTRDEPLVTLEAGKSAEVDSDSGKDYF